MYRWELTLTDNAGRLDMPPRGLVRAHVPTVRASLVSHFSARLSSDDVQVALRDHDEQSARGTVVVGARAGRGLGVVVGFQLRRLQTTEPLAPLAESDQSEPESSAPSRPTSTPSQRTRCLQLLEASTAAASDGRTDTARTLLQQARDCDAPTVAAFRRAVGQRGLARPGTPQWRALIAALDEQ